MNKTIAAVAAFAALGAGTLGVHALDLKGSDTLKKLTVAVVAACPGATGVINYVGNGSGAGENAMIAGAQTVAPMSRFIAGSAASGVCAVDTTKAEAIEIAGDAIVISANDAHHTACDPLSGSASDLACQGYQSGGALTSNGGLANTKTLATGVNITSWKDTLRLVYFGIAPNDFPLASGTGPGDQVLAVNIARRDCMDPSRLELVNSYGKLYQVDCGQDGGCTKLQHAFRRDENSGTTDFFRETLSVESGTQFGNKGFPFCNEYVPAVTLNNANNGNAAACTVNSDCTATGYTLCAADHTCHRPNNGCAVATSAVDCPSGFTCDPGQLQCVKTCAIGDNASCQTALPASPATDTRLAACVPAGICKPGTCTTDADCGGTVGSCDTTTSLYRMPQSKLNCTAAAQCPGVGATCTTPADMNTSTGWCVKKVDAPASDAAETAETRCAIPGLVGGTTNGTVATVPGVFRSSTVGVGFENQQDMDPARRHVVGRNLLNGAGGGSLDANPAEQVASACADLGVVLPISEPSDTVHAFPNTVCGNGKLNFFPTVQIGIGGNARFQLCPNGDMPFGATAWDPVIRGARGGTGSCLAPVKSTDAASANCLSGSTNRPGVQFLMPPKTYVNFPDPNAIDARVYNLQVFLPASQNRLLQSYEFNGQEQPPTPTPPDTATAFNESVTGAYYRIHSTRTAKGYSATTCNANTDCAAPFPTCDTGVHQCFNNTEAGCNNPGLDGVANVCCENSADTNQIGCLTIASPCSIGFAGLASLSAANPSEQLTTQPVAGGTQVTEHNFSIGLDKVVTIGGVNTHVVDSAMANNGCIPGDLLSASPPTFQYPIARNLYFSSIVGFESPLVSAGELALGQCMSGTSAALPPAVLNPMIAAQGFVPDLGNYACCRDFTESACTATSTSSNNACANNGSVNMPANTCVF